MRVSCDETEGQTTVKITFCARHWEGEYWSRDIPFGVATTPFTSAIYTVDTEGKSSPKKVIDIGERGDYPNYNPDGTWIYFQVPIKTQHRIFRCREDGSECTDLTASHAGPGERFGYKFSRDGSRVLFTYFDGNIGRVGIMNPDGTAPSLVAPDIGYHYMADISPDNRTVVFAHTHRGYVLASKNLVTGEFNTLTPDHPESFAPQFTPDGKTLIFIRRDCDIYRIDADGGNMRQMTQGNKYLSFLLSPRDKHGSTDGPTLSPDGKRVAYIAVRDGVSQVHVMNIDGSGQRQVTTRKTPCGRATFGPDNRTIGFVSWEGDHTQLFVVDAEGGVPRKLTNVQGAVCSLSWKPV